MKINLIMCFAINVNKVITGNLCRWFILHPNLIMTEDIPAHFLVSVTEGKELTQAKHVIKIIYQHPP